ncbi:MAG: hypothetical protein U0457_08555 [Candidatus Sericytochromatia bacterium]
MSTVLASPLQSNTVINNFIKNTTTTGRLNPTEYQKAKEEFGKIAPNTNFDNFLANAFSGKVDTEASQKLLAQAKNLTTQPKAQTELPFLDVSVSGDIALNGRENNIENGKIKIDLSSPTAQAALKKLDPDLKELKYSEKNGEGKYTLTHNNQLTWDDWFKVQVDIKTDKNGRLYIEPTNTMASTFSGTMVENIKENMSKSLGIKLKADYETTTNTYANEFGITDNVEVKTGRIYLTPESVSQNIAGKNISGDLKDTKFKITPQGIEVDFSAKNIKVGEPKKDPPKMVDVPEYDIMGNSTGVSHQEEVKPAPTVNGDMPNIKINLDKVNAKIEANTPEEIKNVVSQMQTVLKAGGVNAEGLKNALKNSGIPENIISGLTSLDSKTVDNILKSPDISEKIKKISLNLNINSLAINVNQKDTQINSTNNAPSISAKTSVEIKRDLNTDLLDRLKNDLKDKKKVENITKTLSESGLSKEDIKNLGKLKTEEDIKKLNPEISNKLTAALDKIYPKVTEGTVQASSVNATIDDKNNLSGTVGDANAGITVNSGDSTTQASVTAKNISNKDSGKITAQNLDAILKADNVKLTPKQIEELQGVLKNAKELIGKQLEKVGLTEKQFIAISKAVTRLGKESGNVHNQIQNIAKASGATPQQIKDVMDLLSNKEFNHALDDFSKISHSIKNGKFNVDASIKAEKFNLTQNDQEFIASADALKGKINFSSQGGLTVNADKLDAKNVTLTNNQQGTTISADRINTGDVTVKGNKGTIKGHLNISNPNFNHDNTSGITKIITNEANAGISTGSGSKATAKITNSKTEISNDHGSLHASNLNANLELGSIKAEATAKEVAAKNNGLTASKVTFNGQITRKEGDSKGHVGVKGTTDKITTSKNGLDVQNTNAKLNVDINTPIASIKGNTNITAGSLTIDSKGQSNIEGLSFNRTTGNASISFGKLKKILQNDPNGKKILQNIQEKGLNIPENQKLNFKIDNGAFKDGKLSGNVSLAGFDFGLGKADLSLRIDSFDPSSNKAKITSKGNLKINIAPDKMAPFLKDKMKDFISDPSVSINNGQVITNFNKMMTNGQVRAFIEDNQIKIAVDKAKFLDIFSVKGMAKDQLEDALKEKGISTSSDGKNVTISLASLNKYLNKNVLEGFNLSSLNSSNNNTFSADFSFIK